MFQNLIPSANIAKVWTVLVANRSTKGRIGLRGTFNTRNFRFIFKRAKTVFPLLERPSPWFVQRGCLRPSLLFSMPVAIGIRGCIQKTDVPRDVSCDANTYRLFTRRAIFEAIRQSDIRETFVPTSLESRGPCLPREGEAAF